MISGLFAAFETGMRDREFGEDQHAEQCYRVTIARGDPDARNDLALLPDRTGSGDDMLNGWHGWFGTISGVVLLTVAALPLAAAAVWALARRRGAAGLARPWRTSVAEVAIVFGTVPWIWMILLPNRGAGDGPARVNLIPLRDLLQVLDGGPLTATVQIVGNLLVFAALGFFGPVRVAALASVPRVLAVAASCSVLVETLQYVLRLDRVSSVDDVLLNTAGAALAAVASRRWWRGTADASARPRSVRLPGR